MYSGTIQGPFGPSFGELFAMRGMVSDRKPITLYGDGFRIEADTARGIKAGLNALDKQKQRQRRLRVAKLV